MKSKKMAIAGVTAGLLAGAGAGFVLNLPGGASAEKSSVVVQAAGTTDDDSTGGAPAGSIGGGAMDDGDGHMGAEHHGNREDHLREALQPLVDDGTLTAADLDAVVTALGTRPSTPPTPPADGSMPDPSTRIKARLQSLVDDGTLSASDLDKVAAALVAAMPADGGRGGHGGHDHGGRGGMGGRLLEPAATAIGITVDELKTELQAGKTIAEVAVANGKTAQQVIDALVDEATADITQRITDMVNGVQPTPPSTTGA
jgi:hypothetical protein